MKKNFDTLNKQILLFLREYRVVSVILTVFVCWWGYSAYEFVNSHYSDMSDFVIAFYVSIVGLAGWVVKNWMNTTHNDGNTKED